VRTSALGFHLSAAESREPRAESREPRAESIGERNAGRGQSEATDRAARLQAAENGLEFRDHDLSDLEVADERQPAEHIVESESSSPLWSLKQRRVGGRKLLRRCRILSARGDAQQ
jgi:hypothetical protein